MISPLMMAASHEQGLAAQRAEAEREAQHLVDAAHTEAAELLQQAAVDLARELTGMRRDAAAERARDRKNIEDAAAEKAGKIRADASGRIEAAKQVITRMVLPSGHRTQ